MLFKLLKLEAIPKSATVMILVITTVEINETIIVTPLVKTLHIIDFKVFFESVVLFFSIFFNLMF